MTPPTHSSGIETEEVTLLVFHVGKYRLGINLAKVREISPILPLKAVPNSHLVIPGLFELRGRLIPAVSLRLWLDQLKEYPPTARIIVAEFMAIHTGFIVDSVEGILRLQWSDIEPPDRIKHYSHEVLGIIRDPGSDRLITMIDYENIVLTINPEVFLSPNHESKSSKHLLEKRRTKSVWVIDDSRTIRDFLKHHLKEHDYSNIVFFENGKHALETLLTLKKAKKTRATEDETYRVDIIITDIEMPVMDAYTFIKTIKEDEVLRTIPVILFSSLIATSNKLKGELVQADAQLSKSDSSSLVSLMDRLVFR